jgi:hypothetical protein
LMNKFCYFILFSIIMLCVVMTLRNQKVSVLCRKEVIALFMPTKGKKVLNLERIVALMF